MKRKQILINITSYETLLKENMEQIAEMEKSLKELKQMNKIFVQKVIQLEKNYKNAN